MNIAKAAEDAIEVLMFDQWMRHYYILQREDKLFISIPEDVMAGIKENFPAYYGLAELQNEEELTFEKSQATVCSFIGAHFDGKKYDPSIMPKMFDSKEFKLGMYVFNLWMKGHEQYLDEQVLDFSVWHEMFGEWKKMDEVQVYLDKLYKNPPGNLSEMSPTMQ